MWQFVFFQNYWFLNDCFSRYWFSRHILLFFSLELPKNPFCMSWDLTKVVQTVFLINEFSLCFVPYSIFLPCVLLRSQFCQFYNQILRHWLSLIIWHFKTFCKKPIFIFLYLNSSLPMMTHLSEPGVWYMRGPPESPEHGSCHSPLLNSSSVPNILLCLYVVWDTLRLTLLRNGLCWRVHRSCLLSVVNLNYLTVF